MVGGRNRTLPCAVQHGTQVDISALCKAGARRLSVVLREPFHYLAKRYPVTRIIEPYHGGVLAHEDLHLRRRVHNVDERVIIEGANAWAKPYLTVAPCARLANRGKPRE